MRIDPDEGPVAEQRERVACPEKIAVPRMPIGKRECEKGDQCAAGGDDDDGKSWIPPCGLQRAASEDRRACQPYGESEQQKKKRGEVERGDVGAKLGTALRADRKASGD